MHLAQHHFQAQNRYAEQAIAFSLRQMFSAPYGLAGCDMDAEALLNGTVALLHCRGLLPDGTPFQCPDSDAVPPSRSVSELFGPTEDANEIHLALPAFRPRSANAASTTSNGPVRYREESRQVADELTGLDEQPVTVGRRNFSLCLEREIPDGAVSLPIARIRRDRSGYFIYDPEFIPPLLQIGASQRLMAQLLALVEILESKAEALAGGRRAPGQAVGEWASQEVASFWLSNAIHASLPPLRHHLKSRFSSPEALYLELGRLAGALCTFALEAHPQDLPGYDHNRPEACFSELAVHIKANLDVLMPTSGIPIVLRPYPHYPNIWVGNLSDPRVLDGAEWVLGIRSSLPLAEVIRQVPELVKVCGNQPDDVPAEESYIVRFVKRVNPGLALEYLAAPPTAIGPRLGTRYFRVSTVGPCWELIVKARGVGIYAPDALRNPEFELIAVPRSM